MWEKMVARKIHDNFLFEGKKWENGKSRRDNSKKKGKKGYVMKKDPKIDGTQKRIRAIKALQIFTLFI